MVEPNEQQKRVIDNTEGIYLVDAGAGTGKTTTLVRRYCRLLEKTDVRPEDILMITFTRAGADEMKTRIAREAPVDPTLIEEAPIRTFHSHCRRLLDRDGLRAPSYLGLDEPYAADTNILENEYLEMHHVRRFLDGFLEERPRHRSVYRTVRDPENLLSLIKNLASRGIVPEENGWYQNGRQLLEGSLENFLSLFQDANRSDGNRQSSLRKSLNIVFYRKNFSPDAPDKEEVRGPRGTKQIDEKWAKEAFRDDRDSLFSFVHDLYADYLSYALARNYVNYSFLLVLTYVLLCEDDELRANSRHRYVMIDEFQDTSEIQFKLGLLLAETNNICAVGDWKQSIFSFQHAEVENILAFEDRLQRFADDINRDRSRIDYSVSEVTTIPLETSYRSPQELIHFAEDNSLTLPGKSSEDLPEETIRQRITNLTAERSGSNPRITAYHCDDQIRWILYRIQEMVGNDRFEVEDEEGEGWRPPRYEDIAVLSRRRQFPLDLQEEARRREIPVAFEGGVELFHLDPAKLLLAFLRILEEPHSKRGWSVVLEHAGYRMDEINAYLHETSGAPDLYRNYPEDLRTFVDELAEAGPISEIARRVFDRYGYTDEYADTILTVLDETFRDSLMSHGEIVQFITSAIENGDTYDVSVQSENAVTVQTIHGAKGREYPIVFVADVNRSRFPPSGGGGNGRILFRDPVGLRRKKVMGEEGDGFGEILYDSWQTGFLQACFSGGYDEERRLMYVAQTRARDHLFFTAGGEGIPSSFFDHLDLDPEEVEAPEELPAGGESDREGAELSVELPPETVPVKLPVHAVMDSSMFEERERGRGTAFGKALHEFAEKVAAGEPAEPANTDQQHVRDFIASLEGTHHPEQTGLLPLDLPNHRVTLEGTPDLITVGSDRVEVVDFKTDLDRRAQEEYRFQVSVYHHMVTAEYPEKDVTAGVFYTADGERVSVEPMTVAEIREWVRERM